METQTGPRSVKKRTPNACQRCRRHKIKCSGSAPCTNCLKKAKVCTFDNAQNSVMVSKKYLSTLKKRLAALEDASDPGVHYSSESTPVCTGDPQGSNHIGDPTNSGRQDHSSSASRLFGTPGCGMLPSLERSQRSQMTGANELSRQPSVQEEDMINPLSAGPSDSGFISDLAKGQSIYLGTSSNWSFSRRVLDEAHQAVHRTRLSPNNFALDGEVYSLGWDGLKIPKDLNKRVVIPSMNHAVYLARSAQFHVGELYHLFHEETFMPELYNLYNNLADEAQKQKLWYCHFLLVMACGKAAISRGPERDKPPGVEMFVHAMKLLPDVSKLWTDPFTTAEIFCCAALYLQGADYRYGAYLTIGHAMRTALFQGMHTDMPAGAFGTSQVERARRIWWSVYILDRELSSLMGLPTQLLDDSISASLPTFQFAEQAISMRLHIKLCRIVAQVVSTVYGADGRLDKKFLASTKSAIKNIAGVAEELSKYFLLSLDDQSEGVSRGSASLHLRYHHCIVLTTRPLLFSLFKKHLEAQSASPNLASAIQQLRILLQMCVDSSERSLSILSAVQCEDLLANFIPFDLEAAYCSGIIILMASVVDPSLASNVETQLEMTHAILDSLISQGNAIARVRKSEIEQLNNMLSAFQTRHNSQLVSSRNIGASLLLDPQLPENLASRHGDVEMQPGTDDPRVGELRFEDWTWEDALSSAQLMNVAELLENDQFDNFNTSFNF